MSLFPNYSTGTVSVNAGDVAIVGAGTVWSGVNVQPGDDIIVAGHTVIVEDVTDPTHLVIDAWPYSNVTAGAAYKVVQRSPLRFAGGQAMADVSALVAVLNGMGTIYAVTGSAPDPSIGEDGQYALKTNTTRWQLWLKAGGVWVMQGQPVGVAYRSDVNGGVYSSAFAYAIGDMTTYAGALYISNVASNLNNTPSSSPTDWSVAAVGGTNGATWTSGTGVPSGGNSGDFYLRTSTDDIYKNISGTWSIIVNIQGIQGNAGSTGTPGAAATIAVNSTNTLSAGSSATVTNIGTSAIASLMFGIPTGATGVQGIQGPQGQGVNPGATGTLTQRSTYDGQTQGFSFLETDTAPFRLWVKASNTSSDWAGPTFIGGAAAIGDLGSVTDSVLQTFDYGVAA